MLSEREADRRLRGNREPDAGGAAVPGAPAAVCDVRRPAGRHPLRRRHRRLAGAGVGAGGAALGDDPQQRVISRASHASIGARGVQWPGAGDGR